IDAMKNLGIEQVITTCPECYRTLSHDYPEHGIDVPFKVTHMYDILETEISKGAVEFKETGKKITFQDSCRLSRFAGRADLPRKLLQRLKPDIFKEMPETGSAAICCGNTGWTGCDSHSKALQAKRLRQARATGSDLLITSCPKCQIHLKCAMQDPFLGNELSMDVMDLTSMIAKTIYWK
ncbi:MAG: (Fe-S)-binding protein, partial [Proteobacteria bacterium]|nr:(Fe-S)-binding protein [Pseudomonadota bacterium]